MVKNLPASARDTPVLSLVQEDSTCHRATKPVCHSYWAYALELRNYSYWVHALKLDEPLLAATRENLHSDEDPAEPKNKNEKQSHGIKCVHSCSLNYLMNPVFNPGHQVLRAGALGWPRGMGWGGRWKGCSGWGTHVNPWLIHVNVWQKPLQYCKVMSLQLIKINGKIIFIKSCFICLSELWIISLVKANIYDENTRGI